MFGFCLLTASALNVAASLQCQFAFVFVVICSPCLTLDKLGVCFIESIIIMVNYQILDGLAGNLKIFLSFLCPADILLSSVVAI